MKELERPVNNAAPNDMGWASDVAAEMLRKLNIKYVSLNPGASYRGFHDSLVNYLGNGAPQMLLCLHEDHVVSVAHGYAKVADEPMACVLHSNVGLMHGLMGVFNAWCDRMPILALGATGPVAADKRRPWIDWIHTAKDQGALLRNFTKWDDEPRSPEAIVEGMLKAYQMATTPPYGPVYVCLDAGLQEQKLDRSVAIPDPSRFRAAAAPSASEAQVAALADMIAVAKNPLFLFGRGSRQQDAWDRRVALVEHAGAAVLTSIRERAVFPNDHPQHAVPPSYWLSPKAKDVVKGSDLVVSFDWVDLNGFFLQMSRKTADTAAKIAHVSLDQALHNGWSMDHFSLPPADLGMKSETPSVASPGYGAAIVELLTQLGAQVVYTYRSEPGPTAALPLSVPFLFCLIPISRELSRGAAHIWGPLFAVAVIGFYGIMVLCLFIGALCCCDAPIDFRSRRFAMLA